MSPSRTFILRPVATTLFMAAILLAGIGRLHAAADFRAAGGRLSDDADRHVLSRREPGGHGLVGHRAAGAAVRPGAGPAADDLDQFGRQLGHHAAVQSQPEHRRRRAGGAAGDQRLGHLPAGRPAQPADLQQDQSGRCADHHAGADLGYAAAFRRSRIWPTRGSRRKSPRSPASDWSASSAARSRPCASRPTRRRFPPTASTWRTSAPPSRRPTPTRPREVSTGPLQTYQIGANDQLLDQQPTTRTSSSPIATTRRCGSPMWPTSSTTTRTTCRPRG